MRFQNCNTSAHCNAEHFEQRILMLQRNIATARTEWLLINWICTFLNRYHVPRSFLQPGSNDLVLFEHFGGDPSKISFVMRQTGSVCAQVSEAHPAQIDSWSSQQPMQRYGPALRLECPKEGQVISSVKFASFGTPSGTCGSYSHGECSSTQALSIVQEVTSHPFSCFNVSTEFLWVADSVTANSAGLHRSEQLQRASVVELFWKSMYRGHKKPCSWSCMLVTCLINIGS